MNLTALSDCFKRQRLSGTPRDDVLENHNRRPLADAIQCLTTRWPGIGETATTDCPVFVLSAGWRSGSTLLQRMLMPECFIWGEPYGHACLLQSLADPLRCMTNDWPECFLLECRESRHCE